jgi:hypothetical protein
MQLLDQYFEIRQKIFDYFGYVEGYKVLPFEDRRDKFWRLELFTVEFADSEEQLNNEEEVFSAELYYPNRENYIFAGEDYSIVCVDTRTDGNKFLCIFDNKKKRIKNE